MEKTMRVWDFPVQRLCDKHLLAQHHEIHIIWSVIEGDGTGYKHHPEVLRWENHLGALKRVHERTAGEMLQRGFKHLSELGEGLMLHLTPMPQPWQSKEQQARILKEKGCKCLIR